MLDSLRPFVIPALSAKGQKLAFVTRGPFSCRRRRRRHGRGAGRHKSGEPCMRAGSNAQAWAGRGTGTQIIRTGTVFQCAPAAADPAAATRGELTEVGAEREGSALGGNFSSGDVCRAAVIPPWAKTCWLGMCGRRRCISIQQADLTKPDGKFLPGSFADAGDLALVRQLTEADTADAVVAQVSVGTAADLAAVVATGGELGRSGLLELHGKFRHFSSPP